MTILAMPMVRSGAKCRAGRVRAHGAVQVLVLALGLSACARPTGDFDRAEPSPVIDSWMPATGNVIANIGRGEAVSDFNQTDEEKTLRDRAWALVQPPHLGDWFGTTLVEAQRARILPELDSRFSEKAYYELLRRDQFASSETRWQRLVTDMRTDTLLIGPFWKQVRMVKADDIARTHTMDGRADLTPGELHNASARIEENARVVDWVWRSMRFRLRSYHYCIERMLIETPTPRQWEVNSTWENLQSTIALAEHNTGELRFAGTADASLRSSRYATQEPEKPLISK